MADSTTGPDLRATGERIDTLLEGLAASGPLARERAEELVRLVSDLYGAGLEQVLTLFHDAGKLDEDVLGRLAGDDLVASLLLVHGLHPYGVETRVEQALESVRPYLGSHGGDVELLGYEDDGTVRLRLLGSCDGCPSSSVTLQLAVEDAIAAAAPEMTRIEVEEAAAAETATPALIPVDSLRSRILEHSEAGAAGAVAQVSWHEVPEVAALAPGDTAHLRVADAPLLLARIGGDLFAFRDRCARCEATLEGSALVRRLGGALGDAVLRCSSCGAHYDVRRAGACLDAPDLHLDPLPLLADGSTVSVALPASPATVPA